ncbi:MAG: hypothetical protein DRJ10_13325 [Bacteroidetes bacterium]|nr:MAG: hypothetical protein DRJ10_13325 [Bacteroidota bacterium]
MKKTYFIIFFLTLIFTSCTITQEFHFKKDFSGSAKIAIDMGTFMGMMAGMDSTGTQSATMKDSLDFAFEESAEKLEGIGLTNIKYGWQDDGKLMFLSYDFIDIDILNKAMNASDDGNSAFIKNEDNDDHVYFTRKGKTLIYEGVKSNNDSLNTDEMASMKDYYKYKLIFTFDRKVKSLDNPNVSLSEDKKKAILSASLFDVISPEYNSTIKFKLK